MKLNPKDFRYVHFRQVEGRRTPKGLEVDILPHAGMTLAYVEQIEDGQLITYGAISLCHEWDRYNRKRGATKARGRLLQAATHEFRQGTKVNGNDVSITHGIDRWYVLPGPAEVTLHELIEELSSGTGYLPTKQR